MHERWGVFIFLCLMQNHFILKGETNKLSLHSFVSWHRWLFKAFSFHVSVMVWNLGIIPNDEWTHMSSESSLPSVSGLAPDQICCPTFDDLYKKSIWTFAIIWLLKSRGSIWKRIWMAIWVQVIGCVYYPIFRGGQWQVFMHQITCFFNHLGIPEIPLRYWKVKF